MSATEENCSYECGYVSSGRDLADHERYEHADCPRCGAKAPYVDDDGFAYSVTHWPDCPRLKPGPPVRGRGDVMTYDCCEHCEHDGVTPDVHYHPCSHGCNTRRARDVEVVKWHQAWCRICGWSGELADSYQAADSDRQVHLDEHRQQEDGQ